MRRTVWLLVFQMLLGAFLGIAPAHGLDGLPSYTVQFLGAGSVVAINNGNTVVGVRTNAVTGAQTPLISEDGGAWVTLPFPAGATSAFPTDINDSGVIVGVATMSGGRRAIRWTPSGAGYAVEVLPLLSGELASYATGINNLGQIVGARAGILGTPYGFGWLYTDADGLVDLNASYGWFATPDDINNNGLILSGTQTFDLSTQTVNDVGLTGPSNYNAVVGVALNDAGQIVGAATLRSSSLNIASVYRYSPGFRLDVHLRDEQVHGCERHQQLRGRLLERAGRRSVPRRARAVRPLEPARSLGRRCRVGSSPATGACSTTSASSPPPGATPSPGSQAPCS